MLLRVLLLLRFFFFNDTATTEIYTLSLHDALPIWAAHPRRGDASLPSSHGDRQGDRFQRLASADRKSTRLNSSHSQISYAVFCLKKKKTCSPICRKSTRGRSKTIISPLRKRSSLHA